MSAGLFVFFTLITTKCMLHMPDSQMIFNHVHLLAPLKQNKQETAQAQRTFMTHPGGDHYSPWGGHYSPCRVAIPTR